MFSRAQQTVLQIFRDELSKLDITPVQYGFLNYLMEKENVNAKDFSDQFGLEGSTVTGILDRLERKGLISRIIDTNDRRAYKITITDAGLSLKKEMISCAINANNKVALIVGKKNVEGLKKILHTIYSSNKVTTGV
jgi:DNA-binding MarR family transcriptional regulator